jgi:spore germination cell wall hydrolase CwlJ-like protein
LFSYVQTRDSARALVGAALTGSAVGLILAGAYLGGGLADSARRDAVAAQQAPATQTSEQAEAASSVPATVRRQGLRSGELLKASFAGPAAAPFRAKAGSSRDLECLTEAVYYEARGEGAAGQAAVAQVVLNRVRHPAFPKSICGVVFQGCQFSFACNGAMRANRESGAWNRAQRIATQALSGAVMANVGNATHFHTVNVAPNWSNLLRVGQVGLHVFYRFGGRSGRSSAFSAEPRPSDAPEASEAGLVYARYVPPAGETAALVMQPSVPAPAVAAAPTVTAAPAATPGPAPAAQPVVVEKVSDPAVRTTTQSSTSAS